MKEKVEFSKNNTLALKGIAIIMMMFHHCFRKVELIENYKISFFPLNQEFVINISLVFKICVSIFIFITGYGLTLSLKKLNSEYNWTNKELFKWTINRLIKTLSGFWVVAIISYLICQIIDGTTKDIFFQDGIAYGIFKMLINFLGLSKIFKINDFNSTWWYMSLAILFILSMPIFIKLFKKYNYINVLLFVIFIPRIMTCEFIINSYITFLFPLLIGIIFAEKDLVVKFANFKINNNNYYNKILKFIIETIVVIFMYILSVNMPDNLFWEMKFGIIPVFLICYLYEFFIDIPILKHILQFLGKHSMNIFLIHEFIRTNYLTDYIYSYRNFIKIIFILILISLMLSILLEIFKKLIKYNKLIDKLNKITNNIVEKMYKERQDTNLIIKEKIYK